MRSAGREGVSHKARLAGNGVTLFKRRNTVDDPFPARDGWDVPTARPQMRPCGVAVLDNGTAIACKRRLAWTHLGNSELIDITLLEYSSLVKSLSGCEILTYV